MGYRCELFCHVLAAMLTESNSERGLLVSHTTDECSRKLTRRERENGDAWSRKSFGIHAVYHLRMC